MESKRSMRKFLEEVQVWFDATNIMGSRKDTTISTLVENTTLEWYLGEEAKTLKSLKNVKI